MLPAYDLLLMCPNLTLLKIDIPSLTSLGVLHLVCFLTFFIIIISLFVLSLAPCSSTLSFLPSSILCLPCCYALQRHENRELWLLSYYLFDYGGIDSKYLSGCAISRGILYSGILVDSK